jgi:hypothetical protein
MHARTYRQHTRRHRQQQSPTHRHTHLCAHAQTPPHALTRNAHKTTATKHALSLNARRDCPPLTLAGRPSDIYVFTPDADSDPYADEGALYVRAVAHG